MRVTATAALAAACCVLSGLAAPGSVAQEGATPGAWSVQVTPNLWATGLDGRVRPDPRLPTLDVSQSFAEILEDLDAGVFVNALAIRDRVVVMGDLSYVATSRDGGFEVAPLVAGRAEVTQPTLGLAAGYRVVQQPGLSLDILAGLRAWWLDSKAEARAAGAPFASAASDLDWGDPLIVFRLRADLAPRLSALVTGDVGGFGIGSRGTLQTTAVLNCQLSARLYASAGYRHLAVNDRDGGRVADIALSRPVLGLTWRF